MAVTRPSAASALLLAVPAKELAEFAACSTTLNFAWSELRVNSAALIAYLDRPLCLQFKAMLSCVCFISV